MPVGSGADIGGRRPRAGSVAAVSMLGAWCVGVVALIGFRMGHPALKPLSQVLPLLVGFSLFALVGAILLHRRPGNAVGWVLAWVGTASVMLALGTAYAEHAFVNAPGTLPAASAVAWFSAWMWLPTLVPAVTVLPLVFPDGHPPSRRWRPVVVASVAGIVLGSVPTMFRPRLYIGETGFGFEVANPVQVTFSAGVLDAVEGVGMVLIAGCSVLAIASMVVRFRSSGAVGRRQIAWVLYALVAIVLVIPLGDLLPSSLGSVMGVLIGAIPVAIGIAVTRHGLYEIDRLVNRTAVYILLTGLLIAVYVGLVFLLQPVLRPLTGSSDAAVAASTLGVAASFGPLRRRVQSAVDRRFNRARYDAVRTIEEFGHRLRDELDPETLRGEIVAVLEETVLPQHASVWLRSGALEGR